jgi:hypothetical protein
MIGSLATFQSDIGRALQGEDSCPIDPNSAGYRLTLKVRRSWREGRIIISSRGILSAIPEADRLRLVNEYVDGGGGLEMFLDREAEAFVAFLMPRLPNPSHVLTLCHIHQAVTRAKLGLATAVRSELRTAAATIQRGRYASLVWYYADPGEVVAGLAGGTLPPVGPPEHPVLFAPRLPDFFRMATSTTVAFYIDV